MWPLHGSTEKPLGRAASIRHAVLIVLFALTGCGRPALTHVAPKTEAAGFLPVNGGQIYYEIIGKGPPVLWICGMLCNVGDYEPARRYLANEFTVIAYDRRGYGRSPRPPGWSRTSVSEQMNDARAVIEHFHLKNAAIVAYSNGATLATRLLIDHPQLFKGAIFHEPFVFITGPGYEFSPDIEKKIKFFYDYVAEGRTAGGMKGAAHALLRLSDGDIFRCLSPVDQERKVGDGETFGIEWFNDVPGPDITADAVRSIGVPVYVTLGRIHDGPGVGRRDLTWAITGVVVSWLEPLFKTKAIDAPGAHSAWCEEKEFAEALRPLLKTITAGVAAY